MTSPSLVLVHSSEPRLDCKVLLSALPERFQLLDNKDTANENGKVLSLASASDSPTSSNDSTILILPMPALLLSNSKNTNESIIETPSVNAGGSVVDDDNEFETVPLKTNQQTAPRVATITSFAGFSLASSDELRAMITIIKEEIGLMVLEKPITVNTEQIALAKFVLPGGCMVTLSTAASWTSQEAQTMTTEFMTDIVPMTAQLRSTSGSVSSKSSSMRRTLSMPDMIPPVVTMDNKRQKTIFPSLETNVLSTGGNYQPLQMNAEAPIPIETDLFKGHILMLCRPAADPAKVDPYWNERVFSKKRRRLILQIQGKFKYKPTGTVYMGGEISDPMKLGLIANGLSNLILKLIRTPTMHYSFGSNTEKAHICFPASTFFDSMVVTPPGETPPVLTGLDLDEAPEAKAARKAQKAKFDWNTEDTYSMSFHTMYVDCPTWSVVSLPTGSDLSLKMFWANSFASIVLYEVEDNMKEHTIGTIKYFVGVQVKQLGENVDSEKIAPRSSATALEQPILGSDEEEETSEWGSEMESTAEGDTALMPSSTLDDELDDEVDTSMFFDTIESLPGDEGSVYVAPMENFATSSHNTLLSIIDSFCPCWIEMFSKRGKYTTLYAFCGNKRPGPFFRSEEMVDKVFDGNWQEDAEIDDRFSHRLSDHERTRRTFGLKYAETHTMRYKKSNTNKKIQLRRFHKQPCQFDTTFLTQRRKQGSITKLTGEKSAIIARAVGDRHWKEEKMIFYSESGDVIFRHMAGSKIHCRIKLSNIINVSPFPNNNDDASDIIPLSSYYYLQIETFVRVIILMFSSKEERDSWVELLESSRRDRSERLYTSDLTQFEIPVDDFLSKSSMWNCQKRKILNNRRYSFRTPKSMPPEDTLRLAERALTKALALKPKGPNDSELREFLDCAAALKEADAHSLSEEEKCAFFLNIYHIIIMHSYIILGPPSSGSEWISYFNNAAYQCSDDIFSLAELEHNIIRAEMCYPSNFLSRFVLPKSQYHFSLVRPDFRLNFALNSGSLSMPTSAVPIYKAFLLDEQLNKTTKEFVGYTVHVRQKGKNNDVQISLPRVCQWFAEDFGPNASASDVVCAIETFLSKEKRDALRLIWNPKKKSYEIGMFGLKYLSFNYECRFLTAAIEPEIDYY